MTESPLTNGYSSRKRTFDDQEKKSESNHVSKRSNITSNSSSDGGPLLKILIPNYAAGAIIGKGGTNIGELQNKYGAKIRLSPSREFYPGTEERIVILTGEVNQIIDLNNYIMDKVHVDSSEDGGMGSKMRKGVDEERGQRVKIVVPNQTAGLVIGRAGATIKALQEDTGAKILISGRDETAVQGERVITITGNTDQRAEATRKVIVKIASDPENMANRNLTYGTSSQMRNLNGGGSSYNSLDINQALGNNLSSIQAMIAGNMQQQSHQHQNSKQGLLASLAQNSLSNPLQQSRGLASQLGLTSTPGGLNNQQLSGLTSLGGLSSSSSGGSSSGIVSNIKTTVTIQMEIPDILVGAILGKQGKTVNEFIQFSGAKIQFSGKNEFAPGTTDRILTIQGDINQTQIAYFLITQKIMQAETELATGLLRH